MTGSLLHVLSAADTWRNNNVTVASKRRSNVVWRNNDVIITSCVHCSPQDLFVTVLTYFQDGTCLRPPSCAKSLRLSGHFPWFMLVGPSCASFGVLESLFYFVIPFFCVLVVFSRFYQSIFFLVFSGTPDRGRSRRRSSLDVWLAPGADDTISGRCTLMKDTHADMIPHF